MEDATFARCHRVEMESDAGIFDLLGSGFGSHPQLFDPHQTVVAGVEDDTVAIFVGNVKSFQRELLQREQEIPFLGKQKVEIISVEADGYVGVDELLIVTSGAEFVVEREASRFENRLKKLIEPRPHLG